MNNSITYLKTIMRGTMFHHRVTLWTMQLRFGHIRTRHELSGRIITRSYEVVVNYEAVEGLGAAL